MKLSIFFGILIALLAIAAASGAAPVIGLGRGDEFVLMQLLGLRRGLAVEYAFVCAYLLCIFQVSFGSDKIAWSFVIALVSALAILTTFFLVWPVWRAFFPFEIDTNEGWNAYHADLAVGSRPLYPPPDGLIGNNYPPLSFYLIGGLAKIFGDAVYVGRAVSLLATLGLGAAAATIVKQFSGSSTAAILTGLWFVATMARFFDGYVGMNDPQLLAQVIMAAGLVWFIARRQAGRPVEPAVLMMVIAGFVKHIVVAIPIAALVWLTLDDWRIGLRATLVGAIAAGIGLITCAWLYSPYFVADMLFPRTYSIGNVTYAVPRAMALWPPLMLWSLWALIERGNRAARFTMLHIGTAFVVSMILALGAGVSYNAQFDLVFAAAIGIGLAFDRLPLARTRIKPAIIQLLLLAVLLIRLVEWSPVQFAYVLFSSEYRTIAANHSMVTRAEVARIAAIPSPVACSNLVVCRRAGKDFVYDDFKVLMMIEAGLYSSDEIEALIRAQGIVFQNIDPRASVDSLFRQYPASPLDPAS